MVRDPAALTPPTDRNVIGDRVVTDAGSEIGEVVDRSRIIGSRNPAAN